MPHAARVPVQPGRLGGFEPDYADAFAIAVPAVTMRDTVQADPLEWARAGVRGAEVARGLFASLIWHRALGLRLAPLGTPGTVAGWRVVTSDARACLLAADGTLMDARMAFARTPGEITWTTALHFHTRRGRRAWTVLGPAHRAIAPRALHHAWTRLG